MPTPRLAMLATNGHPGKFYTAMLGDITKKPRGRLECETRSKTKWEIDLG